MGGEGERTPGSQAGACISLSSASLISSDFWRKEETQKALRSLCGRPSREAEPLSPPGLTHYVACAHGLTSQNLSTLVNKMPVK